VRGVTIIVGCLFCALAAVGQSRLPELGFPSANEAVNLIEVQRLHGIVVDANGGVVPKVLILVQQSKRKRTVEVASGTTDDTGRFDFGVVKGSYHVMFRMKGFRQEIVPITVSKKGGPGFKLTLTVSPIIDTIVVPGPKGLF